MSDTPQKNPNGTEPAQSAWASFQGFVKAHRKAVTAVVLLGISAICGESVGVLDYVKVWLGF